MVREEEEKEVLFIGGLFDGKDEEQIISNSKGFIDFAANEFQKKLLKGLESQSDINKIEVISASFIGAYPFGYKNFYFKSLSKNPNHVNFINLFALRNFSRTYALKAVANKNMLTSKKKLIIFVYSAHTPLLNVAIHIKRKRPNVHICMIVPDLPQFMDLSNNQRFIYHKLKKIDQGFQKKKLKYVDSFVLLTEAMNNCINYYKKKSIVIEGIVDPEDSFIINNNFDYKYILYTGTLNEKYGIIDLVNAFNRISPKGVKLLIAGTGDSESVIREAEINNSNIVYLGRLPNEEAKVLQKNALFLVNPRTNNEEYTKYSFPSKNLEYLSSGRPVVCYKLDGIPNEYDAYFQYVESSLEEKISQLLNMNADELSVIGKKGKLFSINNKSPKIQCKKIMSLVNGVN